MFFKKVIKREIVKTEMIMPYWNKPMYVHHITYYKDGAIIWYGDVFEKGTAYVFRTCRFYHD